MPVLNHILIFISYTLVIGAGVVSLPQYLPMQNFEVHPAVWQGGALIMVAAIIHLALSRFGRDRRVVRELNALRASDVEIRSELTRARDEAKRIYEAIESASTARQGGRPAELEQVITEVRMLQGLVEQISQRSAAEVPAQAHGVGEKVAAAGGSRTASAPPPPPPQNSSAEMPPAQPAPPLRRVITGLNDAQMLDIVRDGLRNNRVDLFIQPIVSLPQRKYRHYECFSRIRFDDNSMVVPEQYLAIAEREGLIAAIDNMLLFRCVQLVRRVQKRNKQSGIFVNISEHTLSDTKFFKDFVAFVAANRDLAPNLVFEFAQAHVARHGAAVMFELERLARLGFRFSMDQVTDLNFDVDDLAARHFRYIKIDATRMLAQTENKEMRLDVRALRAALERNGIDLIVEKIETEPTLVEILDQPVDYGQGYLFGEPRQMRDA